MFRPVVPLAPWLALSLLAFVYGGPPAERDARRPPAPDAPSVASPLDAISTWTPEASDGGPVTERRLVGHLLPSLVHLHEPVLSIQADGLLSYRDHYLGPASVVVAGTLAHPFSSSVRDVEFRATFIDLAQLDHSWRRLSAPPLELSQAELETRLPRPAFTVDLRLASELEAEQAVDLAVAEDFDDLELDPRSLPAFVAMVHHYRLEGPSSEDLRRIVELGGVADLAAMNAWIHEQGPGPPPFAAGERQMLVRAAVARLRAMRAPPAHGDFRRVHDLLELIRWLADAEDLELLLEIDRPMQILLTGAAISYQAALVEESALELPIHGLGELPSSSRLLGAYRHALEGIRLRALPRLLRLAYDPIDYGMTTPPGFRRAKVQTQARALLEPLVPTRVAAILDAVDGDLAAQREILSFYVDIGFVSAVEPMMRWLLLHPDEAHSSGARWAKAFGPNVVPTLLRYYLDPLAPAERKLARGLALHLEGPAAIDLVAALRSAGAQVPEKADMKAALEAFEARERAGAQRRSFELAQELFGDDAEGSTLSGRLRIMERLAQIAPERLIEREAETISLLASIAMELDMDAPAESQRALELLEEIAFPERSAADDELALLRSRLASARGDYRGALDALTERAPKLEDRRLRSLFTESVERWIQRSIDAHEYLLAHALIEEARARVPERSAVHDALSRQLFIARYWPALLLGTLFGLTMVATSVWLATRALRVSMLAWRESISRGERRRRRRAHLLRAEAELAALADASPRAVADRLRSPFEEDLQEEDEEEDEDEDGDEHRDSHAGDDLTLHAASPPRTKSSEGDPGDVPDATPTEIETKPATSQESAPNSLPAAETEEGALRELRRSTARTRASSWRRGRAEAELPELPDDLEAATRELAG